MEENKNDKFKNNDGNYEKNHQNQSKKEIDKNRKEGSNENKSSVKDIRFLKSELHKSNIAISERCLEEGLLIVLAMRHK